MSVGLKMKVAVAAFLLVTALGTTSMMHTSALSLPKSSVTQFAATTTCSKPKLLGIFVPWYQYLKLSKDKDTGYCGVSEFTLLPGNGKPNSDVPLILLAIVDDMVRIAGLVAVVYVIMGGIQYTTSQGNPDATGKAQSTIINALIGLAIAIVAVAFVTFLGKALT